MSGFSYNGGITPRRRSYGSHCLSQISICQGLYKLAPSSSSFCGYIFNGLHSDTRLEICRDRRDRQSCINSSNCVYFSWKQRISLQNLHINMKFTHLFGKFAHPFLFQLLKFNIFISINHLYWNLAALFLAKLVPIYAFLVCKTFGTKIRSCKIFDKFQVWVPCQFFLYLYFSGIILHWSLCLRDQNNVYDLSITIAANFQSDSVLFSSSFSRRRPVKKRISCNKCNKECHFWSTLILWCIKISSAYFNLIWVHHWHAKCIDWSI